MTVKYEVDNARNKTPVIETGDHVELHGYRGRVIGFRLGQILIACDGGGYYGWCDVKDAKPVNQGVCYGKRATVFYEDAWHTGTVVREDIGGMTLIDIDFGPTVNTTTLLWTVVE